MYHLLMSNSMLGLFLQVLPISCLVGAIYGVVRYFRIKQQDRSVAMGTEVMRLLFVCYLTGLVNLVLVPGNLWSAIWFYIWNGYPGGIDLYLFSGSFNLVPSIIKCLTGELVLGSWVKKMLVGNLLMYMPMGFFLPFVSEKVNKKSILKYAAGIPAVFEVLQPIMGRSFDVDDLFCNFLGILAGYGFAVLIKGGMAK